MNTPAHSCILGLQVSLFLNLFSSMRKDEPGTSPAAAARDIQAADGKTGIPPTYLE